MRLFLRVSRNSEYWLPLLPAGTRECDSGLVVVANADRRTCGGNGHRVNTAGAAKLFLLPVLHPYFAKRATKLLLLTTYVDSRFGTLKALPNPVAFTFVSFVLDPGKRRQGASEAGIGDRKQFQSIGRLASLTGNVVFSHPIAELLRGKHEPGHLASGFCFGELR